MEFKPPPDKSLEPMIRFGDEWIPARDAWKKMETATVVVEHISRFNERFPHLSSRGTREVVPLVKKRLKDIELRIPAKGQAPDLGSEASGLLEAMSPEDAITTLAEKHGVRLGIHQLIQLVGEQPYMQALQREGKEFELNRISAEQTAQLWNDLSRPSPGGGPWTSKKVSQVLALS